MYLQHLDSEDLHEGILDFQAASSHNVNAESFLRYDTMPRQFCDSIWIGGLKSLQKSFLVSHSVTCVVACVSPNKIGKVFYGAGGQEILRAPDYCAVVVDDSQASGPRAVTAGSYAAKFIKSYQPILNAIIASDTETSSSTSRVGSVSPIVAADDKLWLAETIVSFVDAVQRVMPENGVLLVYDESDDTSLCNTLLIASCILLSRDLGLNVLDALITMKRFVRTDEIFLNNESFFKVLNSFRVNTVASARFNCGEILKRSLSLGEPREVRKRQR